VDELAEKCGRCTECGQRRNHRHASGQQCQWTNAKANAEAYLLGLPALQAREGRFIAPRGVAVGSDRRPPGTGHGVVVSQRAASPASLGRNIARLPFWFT
jgi:hypothetical protein